MSSAKRRPSTPSWRSATAASGCSSCPSTFLEQVFLRGKACPPRRQAALS
jgi:hypothetical protein